jgi:hypothetical protein
MVKKCSLIGISLCVLLLIFVFPFQQTAALSVSISVSGGCGSTFCIGEYIITTIQLNENAYADIWVVTATSSWYNRQNEYLVAGTHSFDGTIAAPEGTHTIYIRARNMAGNIAEDSCSYYVVSCGSTPTPPQPTPSPDSDGDGVKDSSDQCYNPQCNIIDSKGCPKDSDSDGVDDCDDDCRYESGPASNDGCPANNTNILKYWWIIALLFCVLAVLLYLNKKRPPKLKM